MFDSYLIRVYFVFISCLSRACQAIPTTALSSSQHRSLRLTTVLEVGLTTVLEVGLTPVLEVGLTPVLEVGLTPVLELGLTPLKLIIAYVTVNNIND